MSSVDIILAVIDEPSTDMGAEIGMALKNEQEVIAIYNSQNEPSRFILGLLEFHNSKIISYSSIDDCKQQIIQNLKTLRLESAC